MPFRGDYRAYGEFEALGNTIDPRVAFGLWPDGAEDLPSLDRVSLPELVQREVSLPESEPRPHQRLPTWPPPEDEPPAAARSPSRVIWQVLLTSGLLVSMALLGLLIRSSGHAG